MSSKKKKKAKKHPLRRRQVYVVTVALALAVAVTLSLLKAPVALSGGLMGIIVGLGIGVSQKLDQ